MARLGTEAHGIVTRAELLAGGVTPAEIRHRLGKGALIREHRGVYRVGHRAPSVAATYLAAVRACGRGALLHGRAAAHLLGLLPGAPPQPEVIAPTERRISGITTHRARGRPADSWLWRGIPATSAARTLVDLAAVLGADDLARAAHEAGIRFGTTPAQVEAVLARRPGSLGAARLRAVLHGDIAVTLSVVEAAFLNLIEERGLARPETNQPAGGRRIDCRWPEHRLTVELDGYHYHRSRHAWERDRRREREAHARGDDFRRYTHDDVRADPRLMLAELEALLSP